MRPSVQDDSIQRKLVLTTFLTSTCALLAALAALVALAVFGYRLLTVRETLLKELSSEAAMIAVHSTAALAFGIPEEARDSLQALSSKEHIVAACIYRQGKPFASYLQPGLFKDQWPDRPEPDGSRFEGNHLILFRSIDSAGDSLGVLFLRADMNAVAATLRRDLQKAVLVLLGSSAIGLILAITLKRFVSAPLMQLAQIAKNVSIHKDYSVRASRRGVGGELGFLIDGFNEMLQQIQERDAALERAREDLEKRVEERTTQLQRQVLERNRAQEGLQQQLQRISLLNQIIRAVDERQDLDSIVQVVLHQVEDHLPVEFSSLYQLEPSTEVLAVLGRGPKSSMLGEIIDPANLFLAKESPFGPCLKGETIYLSDARKSDSPWGRRVVKAGIISVVGAPLMVENSVWGVLAVARADAQAFSHAEREFLAGLSKHVALAAHQAKLYQDLQKAYDDLRQTQQAVMQQQRLQALGQMASGIAHDINNALSPVMAYAELLKRNETALSTASLKYVQHILTAGEDITKIVARMRDFYRRRDERDEFFPFDLNHVAQQVIDLTRPRWRDMPQSSGIMIELVSDLAPNLPQLLGNTSEIREALTNLILNAVDAMPSGGKLTVRTRASLWERNGKRLPQQVCLEVVDTGIGMDEETRRRCLEPFFSTKGQRGTGLGLPMVYGVLERHDGNIEIESQPGVGSTFRLLFPVREILTTETADQQLTAQEVPALRILCIDDEPLLRELMKEVLICDGHEVELADSGKSGIAAFDEALGRSRPFDVVITDLGMPYLDGRQVAQIIKRNSPATPVIMLTGWGAMMKADGELPSNVDGIISKPPRINEIRETLGKLTSSPKPIVKP